MAIKNIKNAIESVDIESTLYEITELGITSNSMEEYYESIHTIIASLTYAENFFIALYDEDNKRVSFVYFKDEVDTHLTVDEIGVLTQEDLKKSMTSHLLQTRKMIHVNMEQAHRLQDQGIVIQRGSDASDWLGVPLIYKDELLGAMVIQSYDESIIYGRREEDVLQFVAKQIALLIKGKMAEQELVEANHSLERRVAERTESLNQINKAMSLEIEERKKSEKIQASLFKITDLVSTSKSLDDFLESVHDVISGLMYAKNEYVALMSDDDKYVEFLYHVDQRDAKPAKRKMTKANIKNGLTERILKSGEVIFFNRKKEDDKAKSGTECASYLGVPLMDGERTFGVLAVQSYRKDIIYNDIDKQILITIGKQVATAILRKKDAEDLKAAHIYLEKRVKERTSELEKTIVKRRKIEQQLEHDSLHDALTSLPNRLYFSNQLEEQVAAKGKLDFAVLFLDLDRFKLINDSLGHHVGDLFLIEVSQRLKGCLRQNDVVARLGGDEFCILMRSIKDQKVAIRLASRILKELKKPVMVEKHSLITSASIGIRMGGGRKSTVVDIMSDADAAMYQAKHQGKNCFCLFDSEIKEIVTERMQIENDLREALANEELFLVYQPVVRLDNYSIAGCEALIRWNHKSKGFIPPDVFIPIAEETGLIVELGEFVAREAVKALLLFSENESTKDLFININVSAVQILSRTFDGYVRQLLADFDIIPNLLNIEITESILIEDYKAAINFVREIKAMGICIYLDDFGTGYSSLSYLYQFPFDVIKLDKSFIDAMGEDDKNSAIVQSISSMANNLQMKIVAEGIENKNQLEKLSGFNYNYGQGYYFSRPIELKELIKKQLE